MLSERSVTLKLFCTMQQSAKEATSFGKLQDFLNQGRFNVRTVERALTFYAIDFVDCLSEYGN